MRSHFLTNNLPSHAADSSPLNVEILQHTLIFATQLLRPIVLILMFDIFKQVLAIVNRGSSNT